MAAELIQFPVSAQPVPETTGEQRKVSIENGYVRLANELVEKLACTKLGGREFRLLCVVIRKTYGYSKKEDWISLSQMADMANLDKANCSRLVDALVKRQILNSRKRGHDRLLGINTNIDQWQESKKRVVKNDNKVVKNDNKYCQKRQQTRENDNHKRHINKKDNLQDVVPTSVETLPIEKADQENHIPDTTKMVSTIANDQPAVQPKPKARKRTLKFEPADRQFAEYMLERIELVNGSQGKTNLDQWANDIRLMREQDRHSPEDIACLFHFANNHPVQVSSTGRRFTWSAVIRSPDKLRQKWSDLMAQYRLDQRFTNQSGAHRENNGSAGQQHHSQQEYIDDISWLDR